MIKIMSNIDQEFTMNMAVYKVFIWVLRHFTLTTARLERVIYILQMRAFRYRAVK